MATIKLTSENFDAEVKNNDSLILVDFWASWCGPCQMMAPVFEELSGDYDGKLRFGKLSTEEEPELTAGFGIQGIPALLLVKNGKELDRIVGFKPKDALQKEIDELLSKHA